MSILVIDTGEDIVGILAVDTQEYIPYRGGSIAIAIQRIELADEVVTYNGKYRDWLDLTKFAAKLGLAQFSPIGIHSDMRIICWSDRIWGSSLYSTYRKHFKTYPKFPDTYEGSNQCDVQMTFDLWNLWKLGELKVLDGSYI